MKLLIVDDNKAVRTTLKLVLAKEFDQIVAVGDPRLLPALLQQDDVDAVLLDMNFDNRRLDGADGLFWLGRVKAMENAPAVVLITAFGDVELAVKAMKQGAEDFVTKPWDNDDLIAKLHSAIDVNRAARTDRDVMANARQVCEQEAERMGMTLDQVKMEHVKSVVEQCGGNLSQASEMLGINRQTLYNYLKRQ